MAITAAITMSSATVTVPAQATATVTVTNNNATDANVKAVFPLVTPTSLTPQSVAVGKGEVGLGPGATVRVAASGGTLALTFKVQPFAPFMGQTAQGGNPGTPASPANPASFVYDVGAIVQTDASGADAFVTATTATLTASAPSHA